MSKLNYNNVKELIAESTKTLMGQIATLQAEVASAARVASNTQALKEEIVSLRAEISELRSSIAAFKEQQSQPTIQTLSSDPAQKDSWADALKAPVKSALRDESA